MTLRAYLRPLCAAGLVAGLVACNVDRYPLPSVKSVADTGFNSGDSSYLELNRFIDLGEGADPADLFINDDGHIYVAEKGNGKISVYDQALNELMEPGLENFQLDSVRGVCVGPEQLLFAVNGNDSLYSVNLQANREELVWGLESLVGVSPDGVTDTLDAAEIAELVRDRTLQNWGILSIDSLDLQTDEFRKRLEPRVLWYGTSQNTRLQSVAKGRSGEREVFVVNNNPFGNRVNRIPFEASAVLFTSNPEVPVVYLYQAILNENGANVSDVAVYSGWGAGTMDGGRSLDADADGNIYYTQTSPTNGLFKAQRMLYTVDNDGSDEWSFDDGLYGRDLMVDRFQEARDITYTNSNVFVVDWHEVDRGGELEAAHRVQVFKRSGDYLLPLGASREQSDSIYVAEALNLVLEAADFDSLAGYCVACEEQVPGYFTNCRPLLLEDFPESGPLELQIFENCALADTTLKVWEYDQLEDPRSVAVYGNRSSRAGNDDEIIFVADGNLVRLFMLNISSDDLPVQ